MADGRVESYICRPFGPQVKLNRDVAQVVEYTSGGRVVAGSSPVIPTIFRVISSVGLERLLDRQEVTSSNLVLPTSVKYGFKN